MNELILSDNELATIKLMIMDLLEEYDDYNSKHGYYYNNDSSDYLEEWEVENIKSLARKIMNPYEKHFFGSLIF